MAATEVDWRGLTPDQIREEIRRPLIGMPEDEIRERLRWDTPAFAAFCSTIVNKSGQRVPLVPKPEQMRFWAALERQRQAGLPMRIMSLKARQVGISTGTQDTLVQRVTQFPDHRALVLAQEHGTAGQLFNIGNLIYENLPEDIPGFKPKVVGRRKDRMREFDNHSWYRADSAKEFESGRGLTLHSLHISELAFFPDAQRKLTGVLQAVPNEPGTLIVLESTANGQNYFKDLWDTAEAGESDYVPFFSPWFSEPGYRRAFANESELEDFHALLREGVLGEDEDELMDMMLAQCMPEDEILERLHWRRWVIRNNFALDVDRFHQEFPSSPIEAFMTTGRHVFDVGYVRRMQNRVKAEPEPKTGRLEPVGPLKSRVSRGVTVHFPSKVEFVEGPVNDDRRPGWRIWEFPQAKTEPYTDETGEHEGSPLGQYVIGGDASGGDEHDGTAAYHVLSVCDHRTRKQVAEYRSRIDPDELALEAYKACLFFNRAWVAIEVTGGWGGPAMRRLAVDFKYPYHYRRQKLASAKDQKFEDRLGWHSGFEEKKSMLAELMEMLRSGEDGTMSKGLADEYGWYVLDDRNRAKPEFGKTSDRLIARGISVCVAREKPLRPDRRRGEVSSTIDYERLSKTGYPSR